MTKKQVLSIALIGAVFIGALFLLSSAPDVHGQASSTATSGVSITITDGGGGGGGGGGRYQQPRNYHI